MPRAIRLMHKEALKKENAPWYLFLRKRLKKGGSVETLGGLNMVSTLDWVRLGQKPSKGWSWKLGADSSGVSLGWDPAWDGTRLVLLFKNK